MTIWHHASWHWSLTQSQALNWAQHVRLSHCHCHWQKVTVTLTLTVTLHTHSHTHSHTHKFTSHSHTALSLCNDRRNGLIELTSSRSDSFSDDEVSELMIALLGFFRFDIVVILSRQRNKKFVPSSLTEPQMHVNTRCCCKHTQHWLAH